MLDGVIGLYAILGFVFTVIECKVLTIAASEDGDFYLETTDWIDTVLDKAHLMIHLGRIFVAWPCYLLEDLIIVARNSRLEGKDE